MDMSKMVLVFENQLAAMMLQVSAAEKAKGAAEKAKSAAEKAKSAAEKAKSAAEKAKSAAEEAKGIAEEAKRVTEEALVAEKEQSVLLRKEFEVQIALIKEDFRIRLRRMLARKSERYLNAIVEPAQLDAFLNEIAEKAILNAQPVTVPPVKRANKVKSTLSGKHPGRKPLPKDLPFLEVTLRPKQDLTDYDLIDTEVTEEMEWMPGFFYIKRYKREIYAKVENKGTVDEKILFLSAPLPIRVIDKGIPGPGLIAQIIVGKYVDHLPLYRQISMFKRDGVEISDSTIQGWMAQATDRWLISIYERIEKRLVASKYLMADETTIKVQKEKRAAGSLKKLEVGKTHQGYIWAYYDPMKKIIMFKYEHGRGGCYVREHLKDFKGHLQTDAYAGYDKMPAEVTMLGCWAHARRHFFDARGSDAKLADVLLGLIKQLYDVEAKAREESMSHENRLKLRQTVSKPILLKISTLLESLKEAHTPKSQPYKAIHYALKQWNELNKYTDNGHLEIDNNLVENSIRPIAIGRKNWLFAGSAQGAQRSAIIYSIVETCKAFNINPIAYFEDIFDRMPARNINNIEDLLPWNWIEKKQDNEQKMLNEISNM